jgi:hypothetical protein
MAPLRYPGVAIETPFIVHNDRHRTYDFILQSNMCNMKKLMKGDTIYTKYNLCQYLTVKYLLPYLLLYLQEF